MNHSTVAGLSMAGQAGSLSDKICMTDWLRIVGMIFYAPLRGMREARDRGALGPAVICAYLVQVAYTFLMLWLAGDRAAFSQGPAVIVAIFFGAVAPILTVAVVIIPVTILIANLFDRRGSFAVVLQQEYGSLASVALYGLTAASIMTILCAVVFHFAGIQGSFVTYMAQLMDSEDMRKVSQDWNLTADEIAQRKVLFGNAILVSRALFEMVRWPLMAVIAVIGLREVFRFSVLRSLFVFVLVSLASFPLATLLFPIFGRVIGSPFLLIFLFFLLRGYFTGIVSTQRARAAFKQNLEAATINPRDSSAHYNLGLIHQNRGELDQARERFQRAIDIDQDELDAHFQLGRIARAQNRLPEAISHFEEVVQRDQFHAQHEIWREIGATYIAAGQFADGRDALERFLDRRENDPEGLYLMGRAHAGLGDQREAASSMQACIDAVKTAPAYKYRTEKRWLHEAQQFLKGKKQEAMGTRH